MQSESVHGRSLLFHNAKVDEGQSGGNEDSPTSRSYNGGTRRRRAPQSHAGVPVERHGAVTARKEERQNLGIKKTMTSSQPWECTSQHKGNPEPSFVGGINLGGLQAHSSLCVFKIQIVPIYYRLTAKMIGMHGYIS